jgi:arylformamidase
MKLYDATAPIKEKMLLYPGDPEVRLDPYFMTHKGDACNLKRLCMGTHTGTHIDAPSHYLEREGGVDRIDPDVFMGPGVIINLRGSVAIDRRALVSSMMGDHKRVFFKTSNSAKMLLSKFQEDYVYLTEDGAEYLIENGVLMCGIDYLSIEKYHTPTAPVHKKLLKAGIVIVEGLNLLDIPSGPCEIYCLPLKIEGGDGAPARALIRR